MLKTIAILLGIVGFFALGLLGCNATTSRSIRVVTATPDQLASLLIISETGSTEASPLNVSQQQTTPEDTATPVLAPTQESCTLQDQSVTRPQYSVSATLNWAEHSLQADQIVTYTNTTGTSLDTLVFQVEPNRQGGFFSLQGVSDADERPIDGVELNLNRMSVPLPHALAQGCSVTLNMSFTLKIPPVISGYDGRLGYLGFTERQLNLGHWMPVVAWRALDEWQVPRPYVLGEQITAETSDFDVRLKINDAPPTIDVAGAGQVQVIGESEWQFKLAGARDIAISVGNGFRRTSQLAADGTVIELYYYPSSNINGLNPAGQALAAASQALVLYEELFGAPYPYDRLAIVEGDFPDGMEFSGLVYVGEAWFRTWRGEPNDWITVITVHEVAHQWWYALVGNDPAEYPYLDEAFATYSEYLYFQRYYGDLNDWWWNFRVRGYDTSTSLVDTDIYVYNNARPYINAAYLKGAEMLHTMRTDLGDEAFFNWLQRYVLHYQYAIATPQDFWGQLTEEQYAESEPVRQRFFGRWAILPEEAEVAPIPSPTING